jgi:hypothetical protein
MKEDLMEIGKALYWHHQKPKFPWRVGDQVAKVVVASDVTFGAASKDMQNFGCGMVAKSANVSIFNNGYDDGYKQLPDPYRLKFSLDSFKAANDDHDLEEITGCACMVLLEDGSMFCYEPRFVREKEHSDESLA